MNEKLQKLQEATQAVEDIMEGLEFSFGVPPGRSSLTEQLLLDCGRLMPHASDIHKGGKYHKDYYLNPYVDFVFSKAPKFPRIAVIPKPKCSPRVRKHITTRTRNRQY